MSTMLASDANNPQFVGAHDPDMVHSVTFYKRAVEQPFESSEKGRPIFREELYTQIFTPGNQFNIVDRPTREDDKQRFPRQWAAYQNAHSGDQREIGTPLSAWAFLNSAQVEELKYFKFFTVENIANASDSQIASMGMSGGIAPTSLRERAKAFLGAAAGTASVEHAASEKAALQARLDAQQKQIETLMAMMNQKPEEAPASPEGEKDLSKLDKRSKEYRDALKEAA